MKPRFPVPVSWQGLEPKVTIDLRADTTVLHRVGGFPDHYRVIPVEDRRYTTPKLYRIEVASYWRKRWQLLELVRPCRLANLPVGSQCLIEVKIGAEAQAVWADSKGNHVAWGDHPNECMLLCGEPAKYTLHPAFYGRVTCRECLKVGKAWLPFLVEPYEHPRVTEKARRKVQNRARIRAKYPTVFDRVARDFLDED